MPSITFIQHDGTPHAVTAAVGQSLMQTALDNLVPGIDGDCGGECSCATCHLFVDPEWAELVGTAGTNEETLLDFAPERGPTSRLGCQVRVTDALDGLVVRLPQFQQ